MERTEKHMESESKIDMQVLRSTYFGDVSQLFKQNLPDFAFVLTICAGTSPVCGNFTDNPEISAKILMPKI